MIQAGLIDEAIKSFLDAIKQAIADGAAWLFAPFQWLIDWWPLMGHFAIFAAIFVACLFIGFFLPFKWVRAGLGAVIVVVGAFILGETHQFKKQLADAKARRDLEKVTRAKLKPVSKPPAQDGGWKW